MFIKQSTLVIDMSKVRQIPQLKSNIRINHTYRFISTAGTPVSATGASLIGISGTVGTTANAFVTGIFNSVKVNKITIYAAETAAGTPVTCSVEWLGFNNSPPIEDSRTSVSTAVPVVLSSKPPPNSLAKFWQVTGNTPIFVIIAPPGSVIDIDLDCMLSDTGATFQNYAVATATVGVVYYLSLDVQAGTHNYTPVSKTTTF